MFGFLVLCRHRVNHALTVPINGGLKQNETAADLDAYLSNKAGLISFIELNCYNSKGEL